MSNDATILQRLHCLLRESLWPIAVDFERSSNFSPILFVSSLQKIGVRIEGTKLFPVKTSFRGDNFFFSEWLVVDLRLVYRYTLSCIFGTLLSLSCSSTGAVAVIQATASSFSRNVTTLYLDPFVRLPALGALIQARLHRATTRGTLVFIERAYHDRNKSQWNLLLRVDRLSLDEPFRLWTTSEVFLSEESERTERNLEDGYLRSPVEHSFSLVWTGKKTIFAHSICFLLIEYCKQTNLIDCRWNCAFQFLFQNFDHLIPWVNPVDFCFNSSTRSSRSLLFSGEDYREN